MIYCFEVRGRGVVIILGCMSAYFIWNNLFNLADSDSLAEKGFLNCACVALIVAVFVVYEKIQREPLIYLHAAFEKFDFSK